MSPIEKLQTIVLLAASIVAIFGVVAIIFHKRSALKHKTIKL